MRKLLGPTCSGPLQVLAMLVATDIQESGAPMKIGEGTAAEYLTFHTYMLVMIGNCVSCRWRNHGKENSHAIHSKSCHQEPCSGG